MAPIPVSVREAKGRCRRMTSPIPPEASRATKRTKIASRHPARSSFSFQKMDFTPVTGPTGGARWDRGDAALCGFCSNVMNFLLRLAMFGEALEPPKIVQVAPGDRMARQKPIHGPTQQAGHGVHAAHAHNRFLWALGRWAVRPLDLPPLQTLHTVAVFEPPFEQTRLLDRRHHRRVRHFTLSQMPGDAHFLRYGEIRRAALHFQTRFHIRTIPVRHSLPSQ